MRDEAFCYITDLHLTEKRPRFRQDTDYLGSQLDILRQVTEECRKRDVELIVCGGDILNTYNEFSWRLLNEVQDILKGFYVLTVIGNHDIPGENLSRLRWGTASLLIDRGVFRRVPIDSPVEAFRSVLFYNGDWGSPMATALYEGNAPEWFTRQKEEYSSFCHILVAHASIGPKKTPYCKGIEEIDPPYDYVLLGDIHDGHPTYVSPSGCRVINPGSLGISSQKDADRKPRCVFVWPHEKREEYVELKWPEAEVFDRQGIAKYQKAKADKFTQALAQAKAQKQGFKGEKLIRETGKKGRFSKCQIDLLLSETQQD